MYSVNENVKANYVHVKPYGTSSGSLKVHIPSMMSKIPMGKPKITPVSLNKSCYANANECKPSIASKLNTQNYATAQAPYHEYEKPCFYFGDSLVVTMKYKDGLSCRLCPEEEDNSTDWP